MILNAVVGQRDLVGIPIQEYYNAVMTPLSDTATNSLLVALYKKTKKTKKKTMNCLPYTFGSCS